MSTQVFKRQLVVIRASFLVQLARKHLNISARWEGGAWQKTQRRPKRHCDNSPPQHALRCLSRPLLSDPLTCPSRPVQHRAPSKRGSLCCAVPHCCCFPLSSKYGSCYLPRRRPKADTSVITPNPTPAPAVTKDHTLSPVGMRNRDKAAISAEALARKEAQAPLERL